VVARLDWALARQVYDIRRQLEGSAAEACAGVADAGVDAALAAALRDIRAGGEDRLFAATTRFYEVIFRAAGHEIAWEIVQRLNGRISRLRALTLAAADRAVPGPERMARIAAAIAVRDGAAARRAVEEHLTEAALLAQRALEGG
jgi:DNA-binding GntR family transcriptional regulator